MSMFINIVIACLIGYLLGRWCVSSILKKQRLNVAEWFSRKRISIGPWVNISPNAQLFQVNLMDAIGKAMHTQYDEMIGYFDRHGVVKIHIVHEFPSAIYYSGLAEGLYLFEQQFKSIYGYTKRSDDGESTSTQAMFSIQWPFMHDTDFKVYNLASYSKDELEILLQSLQMKWGFNPDSVYLQLMLSIATPETNPYHQKHFMKS